MELIYGTSFCSVCHGYSKHDSHSHVRMGVGLKCGVERGCGATSHSNPNPSLNPNRNPFYKALNLTEVTSQPRDPRMEV